MDRWDDVAQQWLPRHRDVWWRAYSDEANADLLGRWLPDAAGVVLKTDLFDEAVSAGLWPVLVRHARRVIGMDLSGRVVAAARGRYPDMEAVIADVRRLPFPARSFDAVVSLSTLDHFRRSEDLRWALRELRRVLRPGGQLILTMDNRANPVIAIRNALPFRMLHALGLVPYYVGYTCGPRRLAALVEEAGFEAADRASLLHCPRLPAVLAGRLLQKHGVVEQPTYSRALRAFEQLNALPGRYLSGNFVAMLARVPADAVPHAVMGNGKHSSVVRSVAAT